MHVTAPDELTVILECINTAVISPHDGDYRPTTLLFDSGSTASCISSALAQALSLPRRNFRKFQAHVFASAVPITFNGATVTIHLLTEKKPLRLNIAATERVLPPVRMASTTPPELSVLRRELIDVPVTRLVPEILIGQDLMHLSKREPLPRLPHGFAVTSTVLGPTLSGAGRAASKFTKAAARSGSPTSLVDILEGPPAASLLPTPPSTPLPPTLEVGSKLDSAPLAAESREPPVDSKLEPAPLAAESRCSPPRTATNRRITIEVLEGPAEEQVTVQWPSERLPTDREDRTRQ